MLKIDLHGDVHIYDEHPSDELVCWVETEWIEDPTIVPAICRAVELALTNPAALRLLLGLERPRDVQAEDYLTSADRICPWCGAMMEPHDSFEVDDYLGWQDVYCPECKAFHTEVWRLADLVDVHGGVQDD